MLEITLQTKTPIWTGGVGGTVDRLHETGLIGSLRWWYEVLVRGLGGYACDPTSEHRCEYNPKKKTPPKKQLCSACYLFGATSWGRKFRLTVVGKPKIQGTSPRKRVIASHQTIHLQLIPIRDISGMEKCLLALTMRLISEYGALGGKTVFKPSDEPHRQGEFHHWDFGIVNMQFVEQINCHHTLEELQAYVQSFRQASSNPKVHWASLKNFWCVKRRYLTRLDEKTSTFNAFVGRKEEKSSGKWLQNQHDPIAQWLAGNQSQKQKNGKKEKEQNASKKVFSFKYPPENGRTFGFVKPGLIELADIRVRLSQAWPDFNPATEFLTGEQILHNLLGGDR